MVNEKNLLISDPAELELRGFVESLAIGRRLSEPLPRPLFRIAERVLRRVPCAGQLQPEDLVSTLLVRLVEQRKRRGPRALHELLGGSVRSLGAVLRHRMHQIATEFVPGRKLRRELRAHLRAALAVPGAGVATRPDSLFVADRFSAAKVAQAVRWLISEDVPAELRELERHLVREFDLGTNHVELDLVAHAMGSEPDAEAVLTARALLAVLGLEQAKLLGRKLAGCTFEELAHEADKAVSTVHDRLHRAEAATGAFIRQAEISPRTARESLRLLRLL